MKKKLFFILGYIFGGVGLLINYNYTESSLIMLAFVINIFCLKETIENKGEK